MKATAIAPSNVAFIKYWGRKDETLRLPTNGSIAMNLSNCTTTTTVEFSAQLEQDEIVINDEQKKEEVQRVIQHIDRIRSLADLQERAYVHSRNNFPTGTGLSSSSSAFAALTLASSEAAGLELSEKELSILARQASGSACRSIPDGFTEWKDATTSDDSYAVSLFGHQHWKIADVIAVVSNERKRVPTSIGQKTANTSPFFETRLDLMNKKIEQCTQLIEEKNFTEFGELIEAEALELHSIMLTQNPSLLYWTPQSLLMMKQVQAWRIEGVIECYFTVNTGQDVHIIVEQKNMKKLKKLLAHIPEVNDVIVNTPAIGARLSSEHLF